MKKPSNRTDVCVLSLHYPPEPTGNAPYSGALAASLTIDGYKVTAHAGHPHYPEWKVYDGYGGWTRIEHLNGVEVQRRRHYVPRPPRGVRRLLSEVTFGMRLFCAPWRSPSVVVAMSPSLFATALAAIRVRLTPRRPRLIVWVQDIYSLGMAETGEGGEFAQRVTRWVEKLTYRSADKVVVIHQRFAYFVMKDLGVSASKVTVIRNWTHLEPSDVIETEAAKARLGWPNGATVAVHTGNMGTKQGLENIVDAARLADCKGAPVHFILVGEGSEARRLKEYARGISRLEFVDTLNDREYRLALGAADVLLVNEKRGVSAMAMPSKLTSYFDAGRPIVAATDFGSISASEVAAADAGIVVPAGEPCALLDAILELGKDPKAAQRYGANGRRHREAVLSQDRAMEQWRSLISELTRLS